MPTRLSKTFTPPLLPPRSHPSCRRPHSPPSPHMTPTTAGMGSQDPSATPPATAANASPSQTTPHRRPHTKECPGKKTSLVHLIGTYRRQQGRRGGHCVSGDGRSPSRFSRRCQADKEADGRRAGTCRGGGEEEGQKRCSGASRTVSGQPYGHCSGAFCLYTRQQGPWPPSAR